MKVLIGWCRSIYFNDPNGLQLEYCCMVRNLNGDDARMQVRGAIGRAALELQNTTSAEVSEVQSVRGRRPACSE